MKFLTSTAIAAMLISISHAAPAAEAAKKCVPSSYNVPNGGFEGPPSLAPWVVEKSISSAGYIAKRVNTTGAARSPKNLYQFEGSPSVPSDPNAASSTVDIFQRFTVCAGYYYNITWDWATTVGSPSGNEPSGLRLFATPDPNNTCPNNCVYQTEYQGETASKVTFPSSSLTVEVPAVANSSLSAIALLFEMYIFPPYNKRQYFLLDNVTVTAFYPA